MIWRSVAPSTTSDASPPMRLRMGIGRKTVATLDACADYLPVFFVARASRIRPGFMGVW